MESESQLTIFKALVRNVGPCAQKKRFLTTRLRIGQNRRAVCTKKLMPQSIELIWLTSDNKLLMCVYIVAMESESQLTIFKALIGDVWPCSVLYLSVDSVCLSQLRHSASCKIVVIHLNFKFVCVKHNCCSTYWTWNLQYWYCAVLPLHHWQYHGQSIQRNQS